MPTELQLANAVPSCATGASKVAIVVSDYNANITHKLRDGAVKTLQEAGVADKDILIIPVPGAWELPFGVQQIISDSRFHAVIALGAVIRGETTHDQHINRAVSNALMDLSLQHQKPVAFGLLTVNSLEQAIQRSGGNVGNKGEESAQAVLACLKVSAAIGAI